MKVEDQLSLIIAKLDEQSRGINDYNHKISDVQGSIDELKAAKADFDRWRPQVSVHAGSDGGELRLEFAGGDQFHLSVSTYLPRFVRNPHTVCSNRVFPVRLLHNCT
jgi:hypothetical protein